MAGLAVVLACATGCTGDDRDGSATGAIGATATQVLPGSTAGNQNGNATTGNAVTGALDGRDEARLDVVSGATAVVVRAVDLGDLLFRASTPDGSRVAPEVTADAGVVRVSLRGTGGQGGADLMVELNSLVRWQVRLDGGATSESVDLTGGRLAALDFGAGSTRIDVTLPRPVGTVPVRMTGGATTFDLRLPTGVEAQLLFAGGAGQAVIDGNSRTGIAGGTTLATPGWDTATDRYRLDLVAGVSSLTLDRLPG